MECRGRVGISRVLIALALVAVVAIAGVAAYLTLAPSTARETSVASANVDVTAVPPSPLVAPGQTQNYSQIQVVTSGQVASGTLTVKAFAPSGLSVVLNQSSVPLSESPETIPFSLKANSDLAPGNYSVTVETSSSDVRTENSTIRVDVVPMLVVMEYPSFIPQNVTVPRGTQVTWINLNGYIGCCDPGEHDISFLSGANYTSPLISTFQTVRYTFETDGVYDYYCTVHPIMRGQVTVTG